MSAASGLSRPRSKQLFGRSSTKPSSRRFASSCSARRGSHSAPRLQAWRFATLERSSRRRNLRPVVRYDLWLVAEHLAAARVAAHLQPIHVVVAVALVVSERLDAGKVLQPAPLGVEEGFVEAEVMRVSMYVCHRTAERDH